MTMPMKHARVARRYMHAHWSPDRIVAVFDGRYTWEEIVEGVKQLRAHNRKRYSEIYLSKKRIEYVKKTYIPEAVLAERDRRAREVHRDLTAMIMGDPLPGYSALERRERGERGERSSSDPLDALVFRGVRIT